MNVKYLPQDERIPYSVIDGSLRNVRHVLRRGRKREYKGTMQTKNAMSMWESTQGPGRAALGTFRYTGT